MPREGSRDLKKAQFWQRMIRGHHRSGMSVRAWCRENELNEPAFYWWRSRLRSDGGRKMRSTKAALVPIHVSQPDAGSGESSMEIVLPGDRRIRLSGRVDRAALADILAVLAPDMSDRQALEPRTC